MQSKNTNKLALVKYTNKLSLIKHKPECFNFLQVIYLKEECYLDNFLEIKVLGFELLNEVKLVLEELKSFNSKGYVNDFYDKFNEQHYPYFLKVFNKLQPEKIRNEYKSLLTRKNVILTDKKPFKSFIYRLNWTHQMIILELYTLLVKDTSLVNKDYLKNLIIEEEMDKNNIKFVNETETNRGLLIDYYYDKKALEKELYSRLDPSIKYKIRGIGVSITQNIYTGFDTEYKNVDEVNNELISVQLSVSTKTLIKFPNFGAFFASKVGTLSNEVYRIELHYDINQEELERRINTYLDVINSERLELEESLTLIIEKLQKLNYPHTQDHKYITFSFNRTDITNYFKPTNKYSFKDLIEDSVLIANSKLELDYNKILKLLRNIYYNNKLNESDYFNKVEPSDLRVNEISEDHLSKLRLKSLYDKINLTKLTKLTKPTKPTKNQKIDETMIKIFKIKKSINQLKNKVEPITEYNLDADSDTDSNSLEDLINESFEESFDDNNINYTDLDNLIEEIRFDELTDILVSKNLIPKLDKRKFTRIKSNSFTKSKVNLSKIKNLFIIGHFTTADLSMLSDFEEYKDYLDILNNSYVTLKKPINYNGLNVFIRDSMLLSPAGSKALASVGNLYNTNVNKIEIDRTWLNKMDEFYKEDPINFKRYALKDSYITLIHATTMEDFYFTLGKTNIPLTLANIGLNYVLKAWKTDNYHGYQISKEYPLSEPNKLITPKGIFAVGDIGININKFVGNYKGGRNECFMFGHDEDFYVYDYDLVSAYTTAMVLLGDPDYKRGRKLNWKTLEELKIKDLLYSYTTITVDFSFPDNVKFPSIPVFIDKDTTVYPLEGSAILTGSEFILAKKQGCIFDFKDIYYIPYKKRYNFETKEVELTYKPFCTIIHHLQKLRREHPKGTIKNLLYKEISNSIYGLTTKGISNKLKLDQKTKTSNRMNGNELSNPLISSWITAFIRSVIGELLHNLSLLKSLVVSVTTDGFITNQKDLESVLLSKFDLNKNIGVSTINSLKDGDTSFNNLLLNEYRNTRMNLSNDPNALEIKHEGKGILCWNTRGQFSLDAKLAATTGLQRKRFDFKTLNNVLYETFNSKDKSNVFIETNLRSAIDIYKKGGSVVTIQNEKIFRMHYDNRRVIFDLPIPNTNLRDSNPPKHGSIVEVNRFVSKLATKTIYNLQSPTSPLRNKYTKRLDTVVRAFIRALFKGEYNLNYENNFKDYKELESFIKRYDTTYKINANIIALLKRRPVKKPTIERKPEFTSFTAYVKREIPEFDEEGFFK